MYDHDAKVEWYANELGGGEPFRVRRTRDGLTLWSENANFGRDDVRAFATALLRIAEAEWPTTHAGGDEAALAARGES